MAEPGKKPSPEDLQTEILPQTDWPLLDATFGSWADGFVLLLVPGQRMVALNNFSAIL